MISSHRNPAAAHCGYGSSALGFGCSGLSEANAKDLKGDLNWQK